jgi:hypothetical protein
MRHLAERLMAWETRANRSAAITIDPPAACLVCEKLRPVLGALMGHGGFRGLLSRALVLAVVEVPWMQGVRVNGDGSIEGLDTLSAEMEPRKVAEGSVVLIAQALGLLNAFIGEDLTLRFVREAWPKISINDSKFDSGGNK